MQIYPVVPDEEYGFYTLPVSVGSRNEPIRLVIDNQANGTAIKFEAN